MEEDFIGLGYCRQTHSADRTDQHTPSLSAPSSSSRRPPPSASVSSARFVSATRSDVYEAPGNDGGQEGGGSKNVEDGRLSHSHHRGPTRTEDSSGIGKGTGAVPPSQPPAPVTHPPPPSAFPLFVPPPGEPPPPPSSFFLPPPPSSSLPMPETSSYAHSEGFVLPPAPTSDEEKNLRRSAEAVERAQSIALKFRNGGGGIDDNGIADRALAAAFLQRQLPLAENRRDDYVEKRRLHFAKERSKLRAFRLKNLEYVAKKDEQELRWHVDTMNGITAMEERRKIQQRQREIQRQDAQQRNRQSGIGTEEQRRVESARRKGERRRSSDEVSGKENNEPTSLYLTGLPVAGEGVRESGGPPLSGERVLRSLFESYGRVDMVVLYRHRSTGELKGDGLIVYGRDAVREFRKSRVDDGEAKSGDDGGALFGLLETVCSQLNGAELPCGCILGVQLADKKYTKVSEGEKKRRPPSTSGTAMVVVPQSKGAPGATVLEFLSYTDGKGGVAATSGNDDGDDDLDDFFASLV